MRMRNDPNAIIEIMKRERFLLKPREQEQIRTEDIFENKNPVYLELGMGKGQFITQMASDNQQNNYIGVELRKEVLLKALKKLEKKNVTNCKMMWQNIQWIEEWFEPNSIEGIFLNFSDPWPKLRHAKRRLTHPEFLNKYRKLLKENGYIQLRTDNEPFFEYSLNVFLSEGFRVADVRLNWHVHPDSIGSPQTEYEQKFASLGHRIFQLTARLP